MSLSLELSKKLHELSVVVESEQKYAYDPTQPHIDCVLRDKNIESTHHWWKECPAPTFEELWKVIPDQVYILGGWYWFALEKHHRRGEDEPYARLSVYQIKGLGKAFDHESPTEAAGMLLVWLKENGHLEDKS